MLRHKYLDNHHERKNRISYWILRWFGEINFKVWLNIPLIKYSWWYVRHSERDTFKSDTTTNEDHQRRKNTINPRILIFWSTSIEMIERKKIYYETEILNECTKFDKIIKDIIDVITINILKMFIFSLISNYLVLSIHDCWFAYYKHGKIDSIRVNPTLKIE